MGSYSSATGWQYHDTSTAVSTDLRNFVQFGFLVKNSTGAAIEMGQAALRLTLKDVAGKTQVAGPLKVWGKGTSQLFHPMTGAMPLEQVDSYRGSLEMQANSGDARVQLAYQVRTRGDVERSALAAARQCGRKPVCASPCGSAARDADPGPYGDDVITWYSGAVSDPAGSFTTFGTERTANGITYGTTFTSLSVAEPRQWIRWGVACKSGSSTLSETCAASIRIDVRGS